MHDDALEPSASDGQTRPAPHYDFCFFHSPPQKVQTSKPHAHPSQVKSSKPPAWQSPFQMVVKPSQPSKWNSACGRAPTLTGARTAGILHCGDSGISRTEALLSISGVSLGDIHAVHSRDAQKTKKTLGRHLRQRRDCSKVVALATPTRERAIQRIDGGQTRMHRRLVQSKKQAVERP
jgi:hypothetical protein